MKDELEFILQNYEKEIKKWLEIKSPSNIELAVSFFSESEKYVDERIMEKKGIIKYHDSGGGKTNSISSFRVTFFQDFSIGEELLTDLTYCKVGEYRFVKIISPFTRDRSYDLIISVRHQMERILTLLNAKKAASNFDPDSIPVIGMDFKELEENTIDFLLNKEFRAFCNAHFIPLKRGVVLEGKPGTGKTLSLRWLKEKALKNKIQFRNFESPREFLEERGRYFEDGKKIFIFEDFDTSLIDREKTGDTPNAVLGQVLNVLEGINQIHDTVSVFTTNKINVFDKAFLRPGRIDKVITYGLPNEKNMQDFIYTYLNDVKEAIRVGLVKFVVSKETDVSYAVLKGICDDINIHIFNFKTIDLDAALNIAKEKLVGANKNNAVKDTKDLVL